MTSGYEGFFFNISRAILFLKNVSMQLGVLAIFFLTSIIPGKTALNFN